MNRLFFRALWGVFWVFFASPVFSSVSFVDDLNFTFDDIKTGGEGNVTRLTEKSSFYATEGFFDVNGFHHALKAEAEKTAAESNLVVVGFSLVAKTNIPEKPYIVATDILSLNDKFLVVFESGFSSRPMDKKAKRVYASCGQALSKDEVKCPLENLFLCIKNRFSDLPSPSQSWYKKWSDIQQEHSQEFRKSVSSEENHLTLDKLKERVDVLYSKARQDIMEEGIGSVTDSEQVFLCYDENENVVREYLEKLSDKIASYKKFLEKIARENASFLTLQEFEFEPVHFGVHLYTTNEMCRFCGDSLVVKLLRLREQYKIPVNLFVSYGEDIQPGSEERRPAGFSHMINKPNDHYKIPKLPSLDSETLSSEYVFQKKL